MKEYTCGKISTRTFGGYTNCLNTYEICTYGFKKNEEYSRQILLSDHGNKNQKLHGLNASGRSPQTLTLEYFKEQGLAEIPKFGALPVSG